MSPELDFGVKIAGLDLLIYAEDKIIQCQLKSNKDTLTGSQAKRSVKELSIFDNPYFASAYDTETSWHFPDISNVERVAGKEFWSLIGIPYDYLLEVLEPFILDIENYVFPKESIFKRITNIFNN